MGRKTEKYKIIVTDIGNHSFWEPHIRSFLPTFSIQGTNMTSAQICFEDILQDEQHPSNVHLDVFYVPDFVMNYPGV